MIRSQVSSTFRRSRLAAGLSALVLAAGLLPGVGMAQGDTGQPADDATSTNSVSDTTNTPTGTTTLRQGTPTAQPAPADRPAQQRTREPYVPSEFERYVQAQAASLERRNVEETWDRIICLGRVSRRGVGRARAH